MPEKWKSRSFCVDTQEIWGAPNHSPISSFTTRSLILMEPTRTRKLKISSATYVQTAVTAGGVWIDRGRAGGHG